MNKMNKIILGLFAVGLLTFNLSFERDKLNPEDLLLQNIELMQANAVEATCDASHPRECTINGVGGVVGKGTGDLVVKL
ncbi:hypothetical protein [Bacteroides graminisolvens]|uniref:hypothetical protein n=1 Tax=Bacteroides graminisolvens TaxID=477666 RepID=UPI0023F32D1A|nr:hypothetical protein [Bacteroides graminisolvens]